MNNSGLALLITPLLPILLLHMYITHHSFGIIFLGLVIYSFFLSFYIIALNLIEEYIEEYSEKNKKD